MAKIVTAEARRELVAALSERYRAGSRVQKGRILAEFVATSGYHRKSAIRILNGGGAPAPCTAAVSVSRSPLPEGR